MERLEKSDIPVVLTVQSVSFDQEREYSTVICAYVRDDNTSHTCALTCQTWPERDSTFVSNHPINSTSHGYLNFMAFGNPDSECFWERRGWDNFMSQMAIAMFIYSACTAFLIMYYHFSEEEELGRTLVHSKHPWTMIKRVNTTLFVWNLAVWLVVSFYFFIATSSEMAQFYSGLQYFWTFLIYLWFTADTMVCLFFHKATIQSMRQRQSLGKSTKNISI